MGESIVLIPGHGFNVLGEQSVGKSFALNHLMDTSFAGSAMRTTGTHCPSSSQPNGDAVSEGVWMSVTPTDDAILVALDFEGLFTPCACGTSRCSLYMQVYIASNVHPKRMRCLFYSIQPFRTSYVPLLSILESTTDCLLI